jgi:hypothetical protein
MSTEKISLEERKELLQAEINEWVGKGFYLVNQTDTTAQMQKDKDFSCLLFLLLTALILLPGILYLLMRQDKHAFITVDPYGDVNVKIDY